MSLGKYHLRLQCFYRGIALDLPFFNLVYGLLASTPVALVLNSYLCLCFGFALQMIYTRPFLRTLCGAH